jgi:hypothetical protein
VLEQRAADSVPLPVRRDIGVADQIDVAHGLDPHDPDEGAVVLAAPEGDARFDLPIELARGHVRLMPAIGWDHPAVGLGRAVDDCRYLRSLVIAAPTNASHGCNLGRSGAQRRVRETRR